MPFEVYWKEENVVLCIKITGEHSIENTRAMIARVVECLDKAQPPVFTVWDVGDMVNHPNKVKEIWETGQPLYNHPALTYVIFVGLKNPIIKFLTSVISSMGHLHFHNESDWEGVDRAIEKLKMTYSLADNA